MNFVAIDFETAVGRDSACAVGIVTVEHGEIVEEYCQLIQPPGNSYAWYTTKVHGLTAADTANAPTFLELYPELEKRLSGKIIVAHNESFDRSVMQENMQLYGLDYSSLLLPPKWECTKLIYQRKGHKPCSLNALCDHFAIDLDHHEALSDARACAQLYLMR